MTTFNILVGHAQGKVPVTVLRVEGDIDAATHKTLQEKAAEVIEGRGLAGREGFEPSSFGFGIRSSTD